MSTLPHQDPMNYAEWAKWYDVFYSGENGESSDEAAFFLKEALAAEGLTC